MKNNNQTAKSGLGFNSALTLLFVGLKLAKVIDWSWVWVLSPIWISTILAVMFLLIARLITRDRKPRKATWCRQCKYRGCTLFGTFGTRYHCLRFDRDVPTNHYCNDGQKEQKEKQNDIQRDGN